VLLPAEQDIDAPMTLAESITESARGEGLVLVVEDEIGIRTLVQTALEDLGYTVLTAEHGAQALELFDRSSEEIVLVLLDMVMPVLDGAETAAALQKRKPDLPILIMSGISDDDALAKFRDMRISGFVPKPFAPEQLAQAVAIVRQRTGTWVGKDRRQASDSDYAGPDRRAEEPVASGMESSPRRTGA
jgi:CheY-like chemotaxis protein